MKAAILRSFADDFSACGAQYAPMAKELREAAVCIDALEWIAKQPGIGPAANWWDLRAKAREALGMVPMALTSEEQALARVRTCVDCDD